MATAPLLLMAASFLALSLSLPPVKGAAAAGPGHVLSAAYYAQSCPQAETIVAARLRALTQGNPRLAPQLIRMQFHDCFVKGCDASILLDGLDENPSEKGATPNLSLGGYEAIDDIKAALEKACPATVSCADIIALAAKYALELLGGPAVPLRLGRLDGLTSTSGSVAGRLPDSSGNFSGNVATFTTVGLNLVDMVALSGSHTVGKGKCLRVENRLKFPDDTLNPLFRRSLVNRCGSVVDFRQSLMINMDLVSPFKFDNQYYKNVINKAAMFSSDELLLLNPTSRSLVLLFARNQPAFFAQYSRSMIKLSEIGVLTPDQGGEVRTKCNLPRQLSQ